MPLISIIDNFKPQNDARLLDRAAQLAPVLYHETRQPLTCFGGNMLTGAENSASDPGQTRQQLGKGESICYDFGCHLVGRLKLQLSGSGSHQDAPAYLKLEFAEILRELDDMTSDYNGWLSRSWIQEEFVHVDVLPARLELPRRYAFRYVRITVLDTSPKYRLSIDGVECCTESAVDRNQFAAPHHSDPMLEKIYTTCLNTLADCMQDVFEDGPKRDQRLWVGDFRLQALTNYVSFRCNDLVKRCLYLFAGTRFPDGRVSACLFTRPQPAADDTYLFDYALFYPIALEEYLRETEDEETLRDLYDVAMQQIDYALGQCDERGLLSNQAVKDTFIDWCDDLDRTACAQAVLIYALQYAHQLAGRMNDRKRQDYLKQQREYLSEVARKEFWSEERGCFLSNGQRSAASQVWMILAGVPSQEQARRAMKGILQQGGDVKMGTPYLHHYYVMALLAAGLKEEAISHMKEYWGGMLEAGADTFWESWDGEHPDLSPYGGSVVNSYCHAWSCTPAYMIETCCLDDKE